MGKIIYDKLIRDRIPEIIQQDGRKYEIVEMKNDEFDQALRCKLLEEAQEAINTDNVNLVVELADLQEIILALINFHGITPDELEAVRSKRFRERGGFEKRIKLLWTE